MHVEFCGVQSCIAKWHKMWNEKVSEESQKIDDFSVLVTSWSGTL